MINGIRPQDGAATSPVIVSSARPTKDSSYFRKLNMMSVDKLKQEADRAMEAMPTFFNAIPGSFRISESDAKPTSGTSTSGTSTKDYSNGNSSNEQSDKANSINGMRTTTQCATPSKASPVKKVTFSISNEQSDCTPDEEAAILDLQNGIGALRAAETALVKSAEPLADGDSIPGTEHETIQLYIHIWNWVESWFDSLPWLLEPLTIILSMAWVILFWLATRSDPRFKQASSRFSPDVWGKDPRSNQKQPSSSFKITTSPNGRLAIPDVKRIYEVTDMRISKPGEIYKLRLARAQLSRRIRRFGVESDPKKVLGNSYPLRAVERGLRKDHNGPGVIKPGAKKLFISDPSAAVGKKVGILKRSSGKTTTDTTLKDDLFKLSGDGEGLKNGNSKTGH